MNWLYHLFVDPIEIRGVGRLLMLAPLILSVSIVYKTLRCPNLRSVPLASLKLCIMILCGMMAIGAALLVTYRVLA